MRVRLDLMICGSCQHPTCMVTGRPELGRTTFPALVGRISHPTRGTVLFDTGYGEALRASTDAVGRLYRRVLPYKLAPGEACVHQLAAAGIAAGDVHAIVLSHLHPDHTGGLSDFPAAEIHLSRRAFDARAPAGFGARARAGLIRDLFPADLAARARFFEDAAVVTNTTRHEEFAEGHDIFGDGSIVAVALPGHAAGHFGIRLTTDGGREVFLAADAAWLSLCYREMLEPLAPARAFIDDYAAYRQTLARLRRFAGQRPDVLVVPSHCFTAIEDTRRELA
ncbi:MBL fold metallo-hydrolase [Bradyrhizobium sp. U87765 SZCCT0131]|uniref:MBL fold metallo-hydrolase n=1 Tax=unclassified Bradyrhizobium TaxID=2631580 RepID=UPI001BA75AF1|nr:MBL fold metallo-hydrolase [Bradyrhizobium sp. U87765 SZCCT0131]MBR1259893.1 MBL fold metallo-hydrolase [Bradyrhizobium sp. U87765 SZCCT0134]MBR1306026.1 MBL fold metallo-hydrolase [Bradyrhizobium sp. U87765 SZCCT0110]MBR1322393.1 MBL fold metallo-hydrolase [Bradyrhizobium sp. U87765 SZCCT0109]MBR1352316.1 MBL fold metallo-hydrolase [Bradyrhizobium sp. U87765 SZCCT0048]